nr:PDDEXK nuclease domain-containing protein [Streptomyces sabulosicollis]
MGQQAVAPLPWGHITLLMGRCRTDKVRPAHPGQLGFCVTVVDDLVRDEERDDPTFGILIAKSRDKGTIEYVLRSNNAPPAVSTYAALPPHVRELMPSAEDLSRIADDILDGDGAAG